MIPTYVLYSNMGILGTIWSFVLPALLGMGIKCTDIYIDILAVLQTGAKGTYRRLHRLMEQDILSHSLKYHFHLHHLLSLQYHFSHLYGTGMSHTLHRCMYQVLRQNRAGHHLLSSSVTSQRNYSDYAQTATTAVTSINESINMAGTMLSILPLLVMYFVLQRYFVEY